jgi:hypothetical protein
MAQKAGFDFCGGKRFGLLDSIQTSIGAHPASHSMGTQKHEADHSPPDGDIKNMWSCTSTLPNN